MAVLIIECYEKRDETMTRDELKDELLKLFEDNETVYIECIETLDGYNGYLYDKRCWDMEDLDELFYHTKPLDILYRAYFGHDEDNKIIDEYGNEHQGEFNPNRTYFKFNGYGNLVSTDIKDYSGELDHWFIDSFVEEFNHLSLPTGEIYDDVRKLVYQINENEEEE